MLSHTVASFAATKIASLTFIVHSGRTSESSEVGSVVRFSNYDASSVRLTISTTQRLPGFLTVRPNLLRREQNRQRWCLTAGSWEESIVLGHCRFILYSVRSTSIGGICIVRILCTPYGPIERAMGPGLVRPTSDEFPYAPCRDCLSRAGAAPVSKTGSRGQEQFFGSPD